MKRILLFVMTNLAVMVVLGIVINVFGLNRFIDESGLNVGGLMVFSLVIGFGGATISLLMSKFIAKRSTGAQIINDSRDPTHAWIVDTVRRFASQAGIGMPEVGASTKARPTPLPPARSRTRRWWQCSPACCRA